MLTVFDIRLDGPATGELLLPFVGELDLDLDLTDIDLDFVLDLEIGDLEYDLGLLVLDFADLASY